MWRLVLGLILVGQGLGRRLEFVGRLVFVVKRSISQLSLGRIRGLFESFLSRRMLLGFF
jgi:hypothetical protein